MVENHREMTSQIGTENPWGHSLFPFLLSCRFNRKQTFVWDHHRAQQLTTLRVPGNQAMNEDREKEGKNATYSIFFSTHHAVPFPPLHAGLFPPPPILYLVKSYWFWEGQLAPPNLLRETSSNAPSYTALLPPNSTCLYVVALVLALIDRVFHCLSLFCAWSSWSTQRSQGAVARVRCQTSV